jgi:hypothetical protein
VKPHGRDCPDRCSQCRADAAVRVVTQLDDVLLVDGVAVREIAPVVEPNAHQPRKQRRQRGKK